MKVYFIILFAALLLLPSAWAEDRFDEQYLQALKNLKAEDLAAASEHLETLRQQSLDAGYQNLPTYSFKLFEKARIAAHEGNHPNAGYLVRQAVALSPRDARVLLGAASFYPSLGFGPAMAYFFSGLQLVYRSPGSVVPFALNFLWLGLIACTVALFFVCIVQLVSNQETHLFIISGKLPRRYRGVLLPVVSLCYLVVPLWFGILAAIGCWALFLAKIRRPCRAFGVHAGVIIICWAVLIPVLERFHVHLSSEFTRSFERLNVDSFVPHAAEDIQSRLASDSNPEMLRFFLAKTFLHQGDLEEAKKQLQASANNVRLRNAALVNLSAIAILQKEYAPARDLLLEVEQHGDKSFALYYNLAQVHLLLLDTVNHRKYYDLATRRDEPLLRHYEKMQQEGASPYRRIAFQSAPLSMLYGAYLRPVAQPRSETGTLLQQSLVRDGTQGRILILGLVVLGLGVLVHYSRSASRGSLLEKSSAQRSRIWALLPAGLYLTGKQPGVGFFLLTVIVGLIVFSFERPATVLQVLPYPLPIQQLSFVVAVLFTVGIAAWSSRIRPIAQENML